MNYTKLQPGDPMYDVVAANRAVGRWMCDSVDHNPGPCSNPECFKHDGPSLRKSEEEE